MARLPSHAVAGAPRNVTKTPPNMPAMRLEPLVLAGNESDRGPVVLPHGHGFEHDSPVGGELRDPRVEAIPKMKGDPLCGRVLRNKGRDVVQQTMIEVSSDLGRERLEEGEIDRHADLVESVGFDLELDLEIVPVNSIARACVSVEDVRCAELRGGADQEPLADTRHDGAYQRMTAAAHVRPVPNAVMARRSPSLRRPSSMASDIATGIDAAEMFPYL